MFRHSYAAAGQPQTPSRDAASVGREHLASLQAQIDAVHRAQAVRAFSLDASASAADSNFLEALGHTLEQLRAQHRAMPTEPHRAEDGGSDRIANRHRATSRCSRNGRAPGNTMDLRAGATGRWRYWM